MKQSATFRLQVGPVKAPLKVQPVFQCFSANIREVGSIDPLLEGTGDQSMGCLAMHPDEADLTAGGFSVNLGDVFFVFLKNVWPFFQEVFRMLVNDSD